MTTAGWDSIGTWLLSTSVTVAPMRFETQRWRSGCTVWSFVARMYQLGFAFHGVLLIFCCWNRSATGGKWVAQTSFCSCSERSPQKNSVPFGSIQAYPSLTSTREKISEGYLLSWSCTVSPHPGQLLQCRRGRLRDHRLPRR